MIVADDNVAPAALDSNTSSSAISAPAENGKSHEIITVQNLNEFLKFYPKSELVHTNIDKENKKLGLLKSRACVGSSKPTLRSKNLESKKHSNHSTSTCSQPTTKQPRKCDNPVRLPITECSDHPSVLYCENSACKAVLSPLDKFCRKCSCCICHLFDDNKDPTLWLVCTAGPGDGYLCGMSCHIECALQHKKAGVVDHGQFMQLDGSYCCASCGKVSGIIGCWKQQLVVAKDAHQVGILCHRLSLSYRLLYGTSKFKELHQIIEDATKILEPEVGHVSGVSPRITRGDVSKLSVARDVQKRCFLAIEKAEARLNSEQLYFKNMEQLSSPDTGSPGFKVRSLGRTFEPVQVCGKGRLNESYQEDDVEERSYTRSGALKPNNTEEDQPKASFLRHLDLNVASVPDLNADLSPPIESFEKNCLERSNGVGDSLPDACDGDSTLVSAPPLHEFSTGSSQLDDNYEHCVKVIRWLECSGHIGKDFRMRFLTWFSLRSTGKERWVVLTFIKTLIEEPSCLAGQLLDTFSETVSCKRPRNGFCSKLWH